MSEKPKIGFIGLGNMGFPMCRNLIGGGYAVTVNDLAAAACEEMAKLGAAVAATPAELAAGADVVITCLPNSRIVEAVFGGENGLAAGFRAGSVFIDMSSSDPESTRQLGKQRAALGGEMLDAPISGGITGAAAGTLTIMVGGSEALYERMLPVFQTMGSKIVHMGALGAGDTVKVINNFISGCTMAATTEAVAMGVKAGLDPHRIISVLQQGTGKSDAAERKYPKFVFEGKNANFTLDLLCKDIRTYLKVAQSLNVPTALSSEVYNLWEITRAEGGKDIVDIVDLFERWCGVSIR